MELISVVVPVYNVQEYLPAFLENMSNIKSRQFRFYFVDDGSSDNSGLILDGYQEKLGSEKVVVLHTDNAGLSAARNAGLEVAQGKYVWFLDPDDLINTNIIGDMISLLQQYDLDIVQFSFDTFSTTYRKSEVKSIETTDWKKLTGDDLFELLCNPKSSVENYSWSHIVKREIYINHEILFPVGKNYEDCATTFLLFDNARECGLIDLPVIHYRSRRGSISKTQSIQNYDDFFDSIMLIKNSNTKFSQEVKNRYLLTRFMTSFDQTSWLKDKRQTEIRRRRVLNQIQQLNLEQDTFRYRILSWLIKNKICFLSRSYSVYQTLKLRRSGV